MTIYIVRHGETSGNAQGVVQFPETPLNERGLAQAEAVGARLADVGIQHILASDYARAHATAQAIHRFTRAPLEIEPGLRERNFGELRGRLRSEVGAQMQADDFAPPGGESWPVFHERVNKTWSKVTSVSQGIDGHVAVVTHGLVCYSLALHHLRLPEGEEPVQGFGNTSVTIVDDKAPWCVHLLNCCAHLDQHIEARGVVL